MAGAAGEAGTTGEEGAAGAVDEGGSWIQQWGQAWQPVPEDAAYGELRTFSGMEDPDQESFEVWLEHANDMLFMWRHVPEGERRRWLMESLGGLALEFMCGLLAENPNMLAQDCLAAMVQVFGDKDPCVTARLKFLTCAQRPQETLFAYVMRLEGLLQSAVEKGAIHPTIADQVRARQVLMRARSNEMLQSKLKRMRLERRPPGFLGMLRLIREAEAWEAAPATGEQFQVEEGRPARSSGQPAAGETALARTHTCGGAHAGGLDDRDAVPAGLGQARPSEAPGGPTPAQMGAASRAGPGGPGYEPEGLTRSGDREAGEPSRRGSSPSQTSQETRRGWGAGGQPHQVRGT
uniref:Paraneoplastic antigen Ma-like C-terminal domain-containing protein n=1 Tax=Canis lupus familiaris TaxID=9615 RepID=A0A8P0SMZ8_CANLF